MSKTPFTEQKWLKMCLSFVLACFLRVAAQSLNGPESVAWHRASNTYFVSNKGGSANIMAVTMSEANGPTIDSTDSWILSHAVQMPHGLEVIGDRLFVCDGSAVKVFDLSHLLTDDRREEEAALLDTWYPEEGATFLNGITSDGEKNLWVTDFSARRIHSFDVTTGKGQILVKDTIDAPNGIRFDPTNQRLIVVTWNVNASILSIPANTSPVGTTPLKSEPDISVLVEDSGISNMDGVAIGCDGSVYISSWGQNGIHRYNNNFSDEPTVIAEGFSQPCDIFLNPDTAALVIPNYGDDSLTVIRTPLCDGVNVESFVEAQSAQGATGEL